MMTRFAARSALKACAATSHFESANASGTFPIFRERPPWIGRDLQTMRNFLLGAAPELPGGERLWLALEDGDKLAARLDRAAPGRAEKPLVVIVHGLAGSESSHNTVVTARHLVSEGFRALRLNLRGSEPSQPSSSDRYHAGKTEDLSGALRSLRPFAWRQSRAEISGRGRP
jgi:predicted alpha/beta-fold hydrolase